MSKSKKNTKNHKKSNPLQEQIGEIEEFQKNAYNPGHYIGTGRTPAPVKNLYRSPLILIILGIFFVFPAIADFTDNLGIETILSNIVYLILGSLLLFGGIMRLLKKR